MRDDKISKTDTDEGTFQTPQTLADLAATPAPWRGVPTIYGIIADHFDEVDAAKRNGWPWRSIIRTLGLQPSDSSRAAAAYAGLIRRKRRRAQAQAAEAAQEGQSGDAGEEVPDPDEWC